MSGPASNGQGGTSRTRVKGQAMRCKRAFWAGLVLSTTLFAGTCQATETERPIAWAYPGLVVRLPDGRAINFRCSGAGAPTVILEGGWAANSLAWNGVRARMSDRRRVCAYDRAGAGFSDPGPEPRDGAAIARDLDLALRAARIHGPFILVGHSAGGLYIRLLANRRPKDVAGFVFVDPSVEYQDQRINEMFGPGAASLAGLRQRTQACLVAAEARALPSTDPKLASCTTPANPSLPPSVNAEALVEAQRPDTWRTQLSELDSLWTSTSDDIAHGPATYGDLPLIVLTADGNGPSAHHPVNSGPAPFWVRLHQELAARSRRGVQTTVSGTSHLMMMDRPDAIVAAINTVIDEASGTVSRPPDGKRK